MTGGPADGERVRTVFLGSGSFGVPALRRLAAHPMVEIVGVVTAPARPVGRRQALTPTPIGALAAELGLAPVLTPVRLRTPDAISAVIALAPGLAVLADYGQIVPPPLLDLPHGALNLHPSALPRWRGASPVPAAILAGDRATAVTLMRMDTGMDTGPVVALEPVPLDPALAFCRSMGAKYIVFVAKHGPGFCYWQTDTTPYGVRQDASFVPN